ncbi:MAG: hypothetical protein AAGK32_14920, partial [Actinomycetota bacterium]
MLALVVAFAIPRGEAQLAVAVLGRPVDELWVLLCAALVFFMQAGFLTFEVGRARRTAEPRARRPDDRGRQRR